jgi:hypothetical protein
MLRRLLVGLLKGVLVGGAVGALLHFAFGVTALSAAWMGYLLYGGVALLAGVVAGQPPWREGAWVASILKGAFGFGVGALLYFLGAKFLSGIDLTPLAGALPDLAGKTLSQVPLLFAPAVATVYATLVELDDGGEQPATEKKTGVRVSAKEQLDALDVAEHEEKSSAASKAARK